jgi:hypothetical protein
MKMNELIESIPPELRGNLAVSAAGIILTHPDGKGSTAYELGAESEASEKEIKGFDRAKLETDSKISLVSKV